VRWREALEHALFKACRRLDLGSEHEEAIGKAGELVELGSAGRA
jgi:hypothetical protein